MTEGKHPLLKPLAAVMTALALALFTLTLKNQQVQARGPVAPQFEDALPVYTELAAAHFPDDPTE